METAEIRREIVKTVFAFESTKGHLKWSVVNVAKAAKVSRTLVYYHFGRTKEEVLQGCLLEINEEFYGLSEARQKMTLVDSLIATQELYQNNPAYAVFFQKWRHKPSEYQRIFLNTEKRYEKKLQMSFKKATANQVQSLHAFFHGLVTAPYLPKENIAVAVGLLKLETLI